jgi:SAM-dependent methyltransferase
MWETIPDMMSRKIPEANVQQAFVYSMVKSLYSQGAILSAGCYEDTAFELLKHEGFNIWGIDPAINYDLHNYRNLFTQQYEIIFSTSVIEHVKDDEQFIKDICDMLVPGGIAILTCDFNNNYKKGNPVPYTDERFYTEFDLDKRLRHIIESSSCYYLGDTYWKGEPDFWYQGHHYSFATMVFKKAD